MGGDVVPMGNMVINRIADMRRVAGLRHRFDTGKARQEKPRGGLEQANLYVFLLLKISF